MSKSRNPILITGIHKSGTTWVGKILTKSREIGYLYEPFNVGTDNKSPLSCWYQYVDDQVDGIREIERYMDTHLRLSYPEIVPELFAQRHSWLEFLRVGRTKVNMMIGRRQLMKDPIAVLSAEWLCNRYQMDMLLLVRHPCGFVASAKQRQYQFPFEHILRQERLMERFFTGYEAQIAEFASQKKDPVQQATLLWKLIYHVVGYYQQTYPEWMFIRNEDLSRSPEKTFEDIFSRLTIDFTPRMKTIIHEYSHSTTATHTRRNSRNNINRWKHILTDSEIRYIREEVEEVSSLFYLPEEWE